MSAQPHHPPPKIVTLGCRLNAFESEVIRNHLESNKLSNATVINTCAVTEEAVRQARQSIRRLARLHPEQSIYVTGCAVQINPEMFASMPEVTQVIGNNEKMLAETWSFDNDQTENIRVEDIMSVRKLPSQQIDGMQGRARAYVQVQNGCDHRCTFCIIPYGRGNARSVPAGEVVKQVQRLVDTGHKEVVLTGVDLTSWGTDLPNTPPLGNLVQRILKLVPSLYRLRISSIDAIEMDEALIETISDSRVAPHLHLSLQHGDNLILKRMKRRHSREEAIELAERLRKVRPEIALGADLIAGFPTETEEQFENSMSLVDEVGLAFVHVFPFSPREGTPAARMPQLPPMQIKARAKELRRIGELALYRHLDCHIDAFRDAIFERDGFARLADFTRVSVENAAHTPGDVVQIHILRREGRKLVGEAV